MSHLQAPTGGIVKGARWYLTSNRIANVDELMVDRKFLRDMIAQRLHAIALGRMMSGRNERHTGFTSAMHGLFGYFAGNECIHASLNRCVEIVLGRTSAPGYLTDGAIRVADQHGFAQ